MPSVLLSRVAEDLFWAARYLERAENTARIIREHTNLIVDFPVSAPLTWEPLAVIAGTVSEPGTFHSEVHIVASLVSDTENPASITFCVARARENLRTCREVIPQEFWLTVNDLHLYVASHADEGVDRRSRNRFLTRVIAETQRAVGILGGVMSSDHAYEMLRLGRTIERADMTTRVLDVRAVSLMETGEGQLADVQWGAVLRSLSALQMFHRTRPEPVEAGPVVDFLLHDRDFPRSVRCCLDKVAMSVGRLPASDRVAPAAAAAIDRFEHGLREFIDPTVLRGELDAIQILIGDLADRLSAAYFRPA
jgi:uncharacterized alpha-E superfamily protein